MMKQYIFSYNGKTALVNNVDVETNQPVLENDIRLVNVIFQQLGKSKVFNLNELAFISFFKSETFVSHLKGFGSDFFAERSFHLYSIYHEQSKMLNESERQYKEQEKNKMKKTTMLGCSHEEIVARAKRDGYAFTYHFTALFR